MKEEKSKVNIRKSGNGYLIEITNTPIDQVYAITRDELEQIVLYGQVVLANTEIVSSPRRLEQK